MEALVFYPFAGLALLGALGVVLLARPTRALLSLILTMFALAVLFLQLGAPFVAMVHLVVYAGAVLVLFLFVIMLLGTGAREGDVLENARLPYLGLCFFIPSAFAALILFLVRGFEKNPLAGVEGSPAAFGKLLFTKYLLPFELITFLILVGVFAAVTLVGKRRGG